MGGKGSGRPPSVKSILNNSMPKQTPIGTSIVIPNYSGVQKEALKISPKIRTGTTDHTALSNIGTMTHAVLETTIRNISGMQVIDANNITSLSGQRVVNTNNITSLSGVYIAHANNTTDPHGATLSQTILSGVSIIAGGTISGSKLINTADFTTMSGAYIANIIFGTGSTAPTASTYTQGSIYVQYTP